MQRVSPQEGMHVTLLAKGAAEAHDRRVYNVGVNVHLGWRPYTILVSHKAVSQCAFHSMERFRQWLGKDYRVRISGPWQHGGIRTGYVERRPRRV